jgi:hypothetical protein
LIATDFASVRLLRLDSARRDVQTEHHECSNCHDPHLEAFRAEPLDAFKNTRSGSPSEGDLDRIRFDPHTAGGDCREEAKPELVTRFQRN